MYMVVEGSKSHLLQPGVEIILVNELRNWVHSVTQCGHKNHFPQ